MKDYIKPFIEEEYVEVEDICSISAGGAGTENVGDIWTDLKPEND